MHGRASLLRVSALALLVALLASCAPAAVGDPPASSPRPVGPVSTDELDLPVLLEGARCPAPTTAAPDARLEVLLADGSTAVVDEPTVDRLEQRDRARPRRPRHRVCRWDAVIESIGGTVLLSVVDGDGQRRSSIPIDARVSPGARTAVPVTVAPARCDPHAIAEDKQGTRFPVTVHLDGRAGPAITIIVAADDDVRSGVYAAIRQACGLPG